jgi:3-hydroxy acid dehydrogenase / malonic semialdehyde reductase
VTTALITGATSGIGHAITLALAAAGYEVYAVGRNESALKSLRTVTPGIVPIALDLSDREAVDAAISGLRIDVLINNAGVMPPLGNFADMKMSDIDSVLEINLSVAIVLTRLLAPQMRARQSGHILFTGSSAGHMPSPNFAVYAATKAAISSFAASLRGDLSAFGVRVTEIVPGRVETQLYKDILDAETRQKMYADNVAVQPEDVAKMVVAVLSLPPSADVTRLDIMPTRPTPPIKIKTGV